MRLGQHFLKNPAVLRKIASQIEDVQNIIEIGPGHGELTDELLAHNENLKIVALEKDVELANQLKEKYKNNPNIEIIQGDALKLLPQTAQKLKNKKYGIAGNIPYYISGHLFRVIGELENLPVKSIFTVQKEVALRIVAQPPRMNRLAASVQYWAEPKVLFSIPADDFLPRPKVDSAVLLLTARELCWPREAYYTAVHRLFQQPRKTIRNNLTVGLTNEAREEWENVLRNLEIDPQNRPQNLNIQDIGKLAEQSLKLQ